MTQSQINTRYVLIRTDEHGTKYLIERMVTRLEAEQVLAQILGKHIKPHHQSYNIVAYEIGHLSELLAREHILS